MGGMNPAQTRTANQSAALQRKQEGVKLNSLLSNGALNAAEPVAFPREETFPFDNLKGKFKWKTENPQKTCPGHIFHRKFNS